MISSERIRAVCCLLLLFFICITPVSAERVLWAEPVIIASVPGDGVFSPGDERQIKIELANVGVDHDIQNPLIPTVRDVDPLAARGVIGNLDPGDAPFRVKTGHDLAGDLRAGEKDLITFLVQADMDAAPGIYHLRLVLDYSYVSSYEYFLLSQDVRLFFENKREVLLIPLRIDPVVQPEIISVMTDNLVPGHTGRIDLTFRNIGYGEGRHAAADISGPDPMIRCISGGVMLDSVAPGEEYTVSFRATVADDAPEAVVPAEFVILYYDERGKLLSTTPVQFGLDLSKKPTFTVVSVPPVMKPGESHQIDVTFRNTGSTDAYAAKVRINAMDPFSAEVAGADLLDLSPGEEGSATFLLSLHKDATVRPYGLSAIIKYYDASGTLMMASPILVEIETIPEDPLIALVTNEVFIVSVIGLAVLLLYLVIFRRRDQEG